MAQAGGMTFEFEEVPLVVGATATSPPAWQRIALISGSCDITFNGRGETLSWDMASVTLSSPIAGDPDVPVRYVREAQTGRELWDWVTRSIVLAKEDEIVAAIEGRQ